jgi:hypothetical protein
MTLRDRQRAYYYEKLDRYFQGLRQQYERSFGNQYHAPARNARKLEMLFSEVCQRLNLRDSIPKFMPVKASQLRLF